MNIFSWKNQHKKIIFFLKKILKNYIIEYVFSQKLEFKNKYNFQNFSNRKKNVIIIFQ